MTQSWRLRNRFDFEGRQVAHDSLGQGEPVVLVHGTPFTSYVWRSIAAELARDHQVFVFDLLGYGQSDRKNGNVSLGIQNRVFAALLHHWGLERPKVIAHDFGGTTALRAHLVDGCDFDCLLLIDPVALRPQGSPFVRHVHDHEAAFAGVPDYLQRAILRAYVRTAAYKPLSDEELEPYVAPWTGAEGQAAFYRQIAQMDEKFTDEIQGSYGDIRCPVHLLWGAEDAWIPLEQGRELATLLPNATMTEVPGSGHLMQEDAPEAIVAAALRFLDTH